MNIHSPTPSPKFNVHALAGPWRTSRLPALVGLVLLGTWAQAATMTDAFASRPVASSTRVTFDGNSSSATREIGEPDHAGDRDRTVWAAWTAPGEGTVVIDTIGSDFNPVLAVYAGSTLAQLHPVALNDDVSEVSTDARVSFPTKARTKYSIAVDGRYRNTSGYGSVRVNVVFTSANDQPAAEVGTDAFAERPTLGPGLRGLGVCTTRFFTLELDEPARYSDQGNTGWWRWVAPSNGTVSIDTLQSDFNTVLTVYTGTTLTTLSEVALSDDAPNVVQSRVSFQARAGQEYQFMVDGRFNNSSGYGNMILSLMLTPNAESGAVAGADAFIRRGRLVGANAEGVAMNYLFGTDVSEPAHGSDRHKTAWWEWTAPADGLVRIRTEGSVPLTAGAGEVNTYLTVYTGTTLAGLQEVAANDDVPNGVWSEVRFQAKRGGKYQIVVDGRYQNTSGYGNLRLRVDQAVSPLETLAVYPAAEVELPGTAGVQYQLQASEDLIAWEDVGEPIVGSGEPIRVLDSLRGTNKRFYRFLSVP